MNHSPIEPQNEPDSDWLDGLLEDYFTGASPRSLDATAVRAAAELADADADYSQRLDAAAHAASSQQSPQQSPQTSKGQSAEATSSGRPRSRRHRLRNQLLATAIAASLVGVVAWPKYQTGGPGRPSDGERSAAERQPESDTIAAVRPSASNAGIDAASSDRSASASNVASNTDLAEARQEMPIDRVPDPASVPQFSRDTEVSVAADSLQDVELRNRMANDAAAAASLWYAASSQLQAMIDSQFEGLWSRIGIERAPAVSDEEWAARVYVRLTGQPIPEPQRDEVRRFASAADRDALRRRWVSERLRDDSFARYWANRLASAHFDLDSDARAPISREAYRSAVEAIEAAIREDQPIAKLWEKFLALPTDQLGSLASSGAAVATITDPSRGSWWLNHALDDPNRRGERLARRWIGPQAACVNCHDQNRSDAVQGSEFGGEQPLSWPLAATLQKFHITTDDGLPKIHLKPQQSLYFEQTDGKVHMASAGQIVPGIDRGVYSVRTIGHSAEAIIAAWESWTVFARTSPRVGGQYIDVIWQGLFGRPLVDSLASRSGTPQAPYEELLDLRSFLASDSQLGNRSLRQLIEALILSDVFATPGVDDLAAGGVPAEDRQMQLAAFATQRPLMANEFADPIAAVAWLKQSGRAGGPPAEALAQPRFTTPPASSAALRGEESAAEVAGRSWLATADDPPPLWQAWIERLSQSDLEWSQVVDHTYYLLQGRAADQREQAAAKELLILSGSRPRTLARLFASLAG